MTITATFVDTDGNFTRVATGTNTVALTVNAAPTTFFHHGEREHLGHHCLRGPGHPGRVGHPTPRGHRDDSHPRPSGATTLCTITLTGSWR